MIDGNPEFAQSSTGSQGESPVPYKCTIMLLKGSIQLDDEKGHYRNIRRVAD